MANPRRKTLPWLPLDTPPEHPGATPFLELSVSFYEGGINYYNYATEPKGFFLHASPMELLPDSTPGVTTKFYGNLMGRGNKAFLEPATRFNAKRLAALAATITDHPKYRELIDHVLTKNGLTLKETHDGS